MTKYTEFATNKRPVKRYFKYALFLISVYENIAFPLRLKKFSESRQKGEWIGY